MKGTFQLARIARIPVRVHWTFGLLILWVAFAAVSAGMSVAGTLLSLAIVLTVFGCVVLHEYGHALTARRFGVNTRDIILTPIGGIARLEYIPEKPMQEILIALAGPAVNLVIALLLALYAILFTPYWIDLTSPYFWMMNYAQPTLIIIFKINLLLLAFNMMPAFPMDGGRVLRALLCYPFSRLRATRLAASLGQILGIGLFVAALVEIVFQQKVFVAGVEVSDLILGVIGVFIFTAARREVKSVEFKEALRLHVVRELMVPDVALFAPTTPLMEFAGRVPEQGGLLIGREGKVDGVLFTEHLNAALNRGGHTLQVHEIISDMYEEVESSTDISEAITLFKKGGYRLCPVVENDRVIGTISRQQLLQFIEERQS